MLTAERTASLARDLKSAGDVFRFGHNMLARIKAGDSWELTESRIKHAQGALELALKFGEVLDAD